MKIMINVSIEKVRIRNFIDLSLNIFIMKLIGILLIVCHYFFYTH